MENKILKLDEVYSIKMTSSDFYLRYEETYTDAKDKKEKTKRNGWSYPNLKLALKKYFEESQKQGSLKEVMEATERVYKRIEEVCKSESTTITQ